ncbi:YhaN family protein [Phaeobacter sp. B1627]|uniref:ATP-binding protein n=1 Tax=Phaeobacter sp. B1627 TaxID=2583809 RepID=UPI00111AD3A8|nr:YhaN family protein [Phaeobacter sp. B1627]TNJ48404.1 hypothetical protein FGE21_00180 [Phaeobacter sp. B1627]
MRIQRLTLDRFGHFTNREFDFGTAGDGHDFHIIYGPNEAGKTTTMEAVLRLFYGFPTRESYAFKHPRNNLQISATLNMDGVLRTFTRLPTRGGSLIDETGSALPEAALSAHLAGLSETDYRRLLCLDDETIERGGEEIANAEGDIGRLLFSAAAGVADLSTVLDSVRARADALWKRRGRTTRIAEMKRQLAEVEKEIKARDVTASAWKALKRDLKKAQSVEHDARAARDRLNEKRADTEAQRRALPLLGEIRELEAAISPYAHLPDHLDFDPERLIELRGNHGLATQNMARLSADIAALEQERTGLAVAPELLELSVALAALEDLAARDRTAQLDLDRRQDERKAAEASMLQAAKELGITAPDADLPALVRSSADIAMLEDARDRLRTALSQEEAEAREVADLKTRVARAQDALQDCTPTEAGASTFTDILLRFDADRLAPAHAAALQAIATAKTKADRALAALSFGEVSFDPLPICPTSRLQATSWAERHQELARDLRTTMDKRDEHLEDQEACRAQAVALARDAKLVSDADAKALRAERDALWSEHLTALDRQTAAGFHAALQNHDIAADTRLAQSRELAQLREIGQAEASARSRADHAEKRLAILRKESSAIQASVSAAAAQLGLPTCITPAEWQDWVLRHEAARDAAQDLQSTQEANHGTVQRAEALLAELAAALPLPPSDLSDGLNTARRLAEDERKHADARTKATEALRQAQRDLARRKERHAEALATRDDANKTWQASIRALLGETVLPERLMASLEPLRALREHEKARAAAARRVSTMQNDQTQFAEEVGSLARSHQIDAQGAAAQTYADLKTLAEQGRSDREALERVNREIDRAKRERTRNKDIRDAIEQEVAAIAAVFSDLDTKSDIDTASDIDALRKLASRAQQVIRNRASLEKRTQQVLSELGAADIGTARAQLAETSLTTLDAILQSYGADLAHAEEALTQAIRDRTTAEHALAEVKGDDTVAALVEQKATLELQIEEAAMAHLELSLGHHLASDAIRRYRDSHRSGMLTATEQCFASLTQGSYPALSTQIDKDAEVLLALDRNGVSKRADEMSKGTRFQLYLALRAAAHAQLVDQGTTLPFFCDDIFETFDEARTSAACRVMEAIGGRGQAIYLTHHRHVVEIAQTVCDVPPVIHQL